MNRKITLFALPLKCGFFGAIGLRNAVFASAAPAARSKKPSAESRPVSAVAPKPAPVSQRNSRRVTPQNCLWWVLMMRAFRSASIQVQELVGVQGQQAVQVQRRLRVG